MVIPRDSPVNAEQMQLQMFQTDMGEVNIVRQVARLAQAMVGELRLTERNARPRVRPVRSADHVAVASFR